MHPKKIRKVKYIPISTNGFNILYNNNVMTTREFFDMVNNAKVGNLIVLTKREKDLILKELIDFDADVFVFEKLYPIFDNIKYTSNMNINYRELEKYLSEIDKLNIMGQSLNKLLSTEYLYKIERKIRFKNSLDKFFAFAYKGGYQEVFKLKEERRDRIIIALDFNSMYIDSMKGIFVEPKHVIHKKFNGDKIDVKSMHHGLYKVVLKNPKDTFFKNYHPFKYTRLFQSFYFALESKHSIEILLFKNEIDYYMKFFEDIEILEGFYSKRTILHPLYKYANEIYQKRLAYKEEGNTTMSNFMKHKLITIHSATNPLKYRYLKFTSYEKLIQYLSTEYMMNFSDTSIEDEINFVKEQKRYSFTKTQYGYKAKLACYDKNESLYSFSSQIVANARLKMVQTIEKLLDHESLEICYTNIDSIHVSIKKSELDNFLSKFNYIISNKIGDLKIETISEKGYWFDIGRYWLFKKNNVSLFKNKVFNYTGNNQIFSRNKKSNTIHIDKSFKYVKSKYLNLINSFSYDKYLKKDGIDNTNYSRYNFQEIKNLNVANDTINREVLNSKKIKIELFNQIASV